MDRFYAFKVVAQDLRLTVYAAHGARGTQAVTAGDDDVGLARLVERCGPDLACTGELEPAAQKLGLPIGRAPDVVLRRHALLALEIGASNFRETHVEEQDLYLRGAQALLAAHAWPRDREDTFSLQIRGQLGARMLRCDARATLSSLGRHTLLLYPVDALREIAIEQRPKLSQSGLPGLDQIVVRFEQEPPYALDALRRGYDLDAIPYPRCTYFGEHVSTSGVELLVLAGTMGAIAGASERSHRVELALRDGSHLAVTATHAS